MAGTLRAVNLRWHCTLITAGDADTYVAVVTEDGRTYLFTSADDNNVVDDMVMMMMMMCPRVSS